MNRPINTCIIFLLIFLFFHADLCAQITDTLAYAKSDTTVEASADTTLQQIHFEKEDDSIRSFKQDKSFAYIKNLDSLLRLRKDLAVDTFSINKGARSKQSKKQTATSPSINFLNNSFIKIILWALAIFFIGFILYKLFLSEILFKRKPTAKTSVPVQNVEDDLSDPSGYDKLIARAASDKNYRLAIRYLYLKTLQMLAAKGFLQLSPDKTNYQYVNEIAATSYKNDFSFITLNYEYVWYGEFKVSEDVYNKLFINYKSFQQKI